jgi:hypothetical protein
MRGEDRDFFEFFFFFCLETCVDKLYKATAMNPWSCGGQGEDCGKHRGLTRGITSVENLIPDMTELRAVDV